MNASSIESTRVSAATLAMIRQLVSFDTTSRESNMALIDWVGAYLRGHGVDSRLTFDDSGKKANLFATIGPPIDGGIVLSGHTDVVPVDGQPWDSDPWQAVEIGDRLVGRGVCDMKSFIAAALALVPEMTRRTLARPLHFALSYDEEIGCIGVRRLIADLATLRYVPGGCIVGEPTGMEIVVAHKGKHSYRCRVRGFEAHSALTPKGVNAVEIACEVVAYLRGMAKRFRENGHFDRDYDVPYTTVHVGTIKGGEADNVISDTATINGTIRSYTAASREMMTRRLGEIASGVAAAMRGTADVSITHGYPAVVNDAGATELVRLVAGDVVSPGAALEMEPMAVAEDFSRVIELVPGALFCLGVRRPSWAEPRGMHTATFDLDESALPIGAAMLAGTALRFLDS